MGYWSFWVVEYAMRLTRYSDFALRTLIYLGLSEPRQTSIAEVSRAYGISENHLTKVVHHLGQLGLVRTTRGRSGGLRLARPPEQIIIGQVVRQTEEDLALVECFGGGDCTITQACRLKSVMGEALAAFFAVLDRFTLADFIGPGDGPETARLLGLFVTPPNEASSNS
ncbi:HTH-type transcriptional repressor NsrR [Methylovirgula sp. HY1]|nr:HTH-type transcriptional repressor NsrR [Methylovirgula sp. HY1]